MIEKIVVLYIVVVSFGRVALGDNDAEDAVLSINRARNTNDHHNQEWTRFSEDYVRCFCNFPSCVSTGYMCKSAIGGCFSNLLNQSSSPTSSSATAGIVSLHRSASNDYRGRHGCLELLTDKNHRQWCEEKKFGDTPHQRNQKDSLIICCYDDMCNHVDNPQTKHLIKTQLFGAERNNIYNKYNNRREFNGYSESEVWFRAATIAVPICGAVILFVLIVLAIKILRNEHINSPNYKLRGSLFYGHQMPSQSKMNCDKHPEYRNILRRSENQQCYYEQDLHRIQVPLLMQQNVHSTSKNETNAKLNLIHNDTANVHEYLETGGKSIILEMEQTVSSKCADNINFIKPDEDKTYKKDNSQT